jgi:hypothetical protein
MKQSQQARAEAKALKRYAAAERACKMARELAAHLEKRAGAALAAWTRLRSPRVMAILRGEGRA